MSRDFDGSTGRLDLPVTAVLRPSLPVTVAAWVNPTALIAGGGIFTSNKSDSLHAGFWFCLTDTSGHLEASFGTTGGNTGSSRRSKVTSGANAVTTGAWQHVATCIRGAGDMDIYLAGSDVGGSYSGTGGAMAYRADIPGFIGYEGGHFFAGRIAEVGLWTVTLSPAEVLALAKGVSPRRIRPGSLLGHWPVWGAADPEVDLSSNSNDATLVGTAPLANHAPVGSPFPMAA